MNYASPYISINPMLMLSIEKEHHYNTFKYITVEEKLKLFIEKFGKFD